MIARSGVVGLLLVFLSGCGVENLYWHYTCDNPDPEHLGPDGESDPCHERDVSAGADGGLDASEDADADGGLDASEDGGADGGLGASEDGGAEGDAG